MTDGSLGGIPTCSQQSLRFAFKTVGPQPKGCLHYRPINSNGPDSTRPKSRVPCIHFPDHSTEACAPEHGPVPQRGCQPRSARRAHGAPGHMCLAASMNADAHVHCTSPPHSVPSPGAMLSSIPQHPRYWNGAAYAVRGQHPQRAWMWWHKVGMQLQPQEHTSPAAGGRQVQDAVKIGERPPVPSHAPKTGGRQGPNTGRKAPHSPLGNTRLLHL